MKKRAELVNDFLDEANSHHFICDADWNLDEDQPLSIYIADKDFAPIFEIYLQPNKGIQVSDYYSKFRVTSPSRKRWLLKRLASLIDDLKGVNND